VTRLIEYGWQQSWQIVLVCGVLWLMGVALRRASAHERYWMWVVGLITLCLPPLNLVQLRKLPEPTRQVLSGAALTDGGARSDGRDAGRAEDRCATGAWLSGTRGSRRLLDRRPWWLAGIWSAGVVIYLGIALGKAARIQGWLAKHRTEPDLELECEFVEMVRAIGIRARPRLGMIRGLSQPFVWGVWRGGIYLPDGFGRQGDASQRKMIVAHELAHVLRGDAFVNFGQVLLQALFWFHPLVWWLNRRIREEREKCCDETAIAALHADSREYGAAILDRLANWHEPAAPSSSLAIAGGARELEDRLASILVPGRRFRCRPTPAGLALLVMVGAVLLAGRPGVATPAVSVIAEHSSSGQVLVDLAPHFNERLEESWLPGVAGNDLAMLGPGRRLLGDLEFEVRGIVQLAGREPDLDRYPGSTDRIRIEREVARIHLLHGVSGRAADGTPVGHLVLDYADGTQATFEVSYGRQVRDWWFTEFEPVTDSGTAMAWTGHNAAVRAEGASLRLYRTTWANPRPEVQLREIRYESARTTAAPFVLGLTVE
jgi:beta-lactamase regulating signal transducer with metallopeptidase domain